MFRVACSKIKESLYGFVGFSTIVDESGQATAVHTTGTAFVVAPGYLLTAASLLHIYEDRNQPLHQSLEVVHVSDIGQHSQQAILVAEDPVQNIALLKIEEYKHHKPVKFTLEEALVGTDCGFMGFPTSKVHYLENGTRIVDFMERFQKGTLSSVISTRNKKGSVIPLYLIDTMVYSESSGCPTFTVDGGVIGMHVAKHSVITEDTDCDDARPVAISTVVPAAEISRFLKANKVKQK